MHEKKAVNLTQMTQPVRAVMDRVIDTVLPPQAFFTDPAMAESWAKVRFLDDPCCDICGFPFDFDQGAGALCGRCTAKVPSYDRLRAGFVYDDASRRAVLAFKHGGRTEGLSMFASQMARAGRDILAGTDRLMPVPLHYSRLIRRRYNQSAILARALSKQTGVALDCRALIRTRATVSQGGQSVSGRRRNVSGAFSVDMKADISGAHITLIDDVFTTGATLSACARTLKRAGAASVSGLVLARVVKGVVIPT